MKENLVDLTKFNAVSEANEGGELELLYKGDKTGVILKVLGNNADAVRLAGVANLKEYARKHAIAEKRGDLVDFKTKLIEKLQENSIENALIRVTGWVGAAGEYNKETMRGVLERNPQWVEDIMEFSNFLELSKKTTA